MLGSLKYTRAGLSLPTDLPTTALFGEPVRVGSPTTASPYSGAERQQVENEPVTTQQDVGSGAAAPLSHTAEEEGTELTGIRSGYFSRMRCASACRFSADVSPPAPAS